MKEYMIAYFNSMYSIGIELEDDSQISFLVTLNE